jgi:polyhydroxyalkanoate synthesis repressor PhaR
MSASSNETVVIKKYANRRLYNTATSTYVTLDNLGEMVKAGVEFNVYDAKTNEDITRSVLTQIIVEEEGKAGQNLLPVTFLRRLIGFYGDNMQWLVPKYLDHSLQSLTNNQGQIRDYFQTSLGSIFPFGSTLEQMSKQNLAVFERTMRMFTPFGTTGSASEAKTGTTEECSSDCECSSETASESTASTSSSSKTEASTTPETPKKSEEPVVAVAPSSAPAAAPVSIRSGGRRNVSVMPTPETTKATAQNVVTGEDVQNKIAALQRQLSDLAKNKA